MTVIGVDAVGRAIAAQLAGESFDTTVILTGAVTAEVEQAAYTGLAAGTPVLVTVLTGDRLSVGPLIRPGAADPPIPPVAGAPGGVLAHHIELAAEATRWYLRLSYEDTLAVDLFGCRLVRRSGAL